MPSRRRMDMEPQGSNIDENQSIVEKHQIQVIITYLNQEDNA